VNYLVWKTNVTKFNYETHDLSSINSIKLRVKPLNTFLERKWSFSEIMDVQHLLATATLTVIIVGLLGNLLSLSLFLRTSSSVNVLLSALAFVDFFLLSFSIPVFVIPNLDIWSDDPDGTNLSSYLAYILKFVYPTNLIFQTSSIYTMVVITIERWFVVNHPLKVSIWCTARTSRRAICCIFLFSTLYNVPRFFEYSMIYSKDGVVEYQRNLRDNSTYMIWYFTASYLLTHFVVPFGLILVLNCHVISAIVKMRKQRQSLTRQQIREQSTTVMLLVVIFIFAICNTLPFLLNLIECIKPNLFSDEDTAQLAFQLNDLSTLLVVFNSSSTWLVYIIFSKKYRQTAVRILW
jgi:hypothetical protein